MKNDFEVRGDTAVIFVNHKGETLEFLIDSSDLELVSSIKGTWSYSKGYAIYRIQKKNDQRTINLHRLLINPDDDKFVDHINHNTFDNRKCNLRIVDHTGNMQNMSVNKTSSSGIRGVYRFRNKWIARMMVNGKEKHFGTFEDKYEAEKVIKKARAKYMKYSQDALAD